MIFKILHHQQRKDILQELARTDDEIVIAAQESWTLNFSLVFGPLAASVLMESEKCFTLYECGIFLTNHSIHWPDRPTEWNLEWMAAPPPSLLVKLSLSLRRLGYLHSVRTVKTLTVYSCSC